jgi:hypothetical protein
MLILLSQNEQGISALDLQKHIFPSGSSSIKSTFPWMQRHYVNYYKGEQLYETNRRETALTHPRDVCFQVSGLLSFYTHSEWIVLSFHDLQVFWKEVCP